MVPIMNRSAIISGMCLVAVIGLASLLGCEQQATMKGIPAMRIESSAFADGQPIPKQYTGEGKDVSPPLSFSEVPEGTAELALICDDPDAPVPKAWIHWVIYKMPAEISGLQEGVERTAELSNPAGALQGTNSWDRDNIGYRGPMPPPGHGIHHYHFKLYALDAAMPARAGLDKDSLLAAVKGHILAEAELVGTYQR